jgi:hypothetical protein
MRPDGVSCMKSAKTVAECTTIMESESMCAIADGDTACEESVGAMQVAGDRGNTESWMIVEGHGMWQSDLNRIRECMHKIGRYEPDQTVKKCVCCALCFCRERMTYRMTNSGFFIDASHEGTMPVASTWCVLCPC